MKARAAQKHVFLRRIEQGFVKQALDDAQGSTYSAYNLRSICEAPVAQKHVFCAQVNKGL